MTAEECLAMADSYAVDENWNEALTMYTAALAVWHTDTALRFRILSHRSNCFYQLQQYESARQDAHEAMKLVLSSSSSQQQTTTGLRPGEIEVGWKRQGLADLQTAQYEDAKKAFQSAAQLALLNQRDDTVYRDYIQQCDAKLNTAPTKATASFVPAPAPSNTTTSNKRPTAPRYQYYQNDKVMTISILEPNLQPEQIKVDWERQRLRVTIVKAGVEFTLMDGPLFDEINTAESKIQIKPEKVLIKLRKAREYEWKELMGKKEITTKKTTTPSSSSSSSTPTLTPAPGSTVRPYASPRDWGSIEKSIQADEEKETPQGDDAMNKLFQQIYANADEDTRRAYVDRWRCSRECMYFFRQLIVRFLYLFSTTA